MKIRTSFVTNSSGSSSSRIVIENKVLCDILKKYTDRINDELVGNKKVNIAEFNNGVIKDYGSSGDAPPEDEFWYWSYRDIKPNVEEIPDSYLDSLKKEVKTYLNDKVIMDIFNELKAELDNKRELINESYVKVYKESSYSGDGGSSSSSGLYDFRNKCPKCGEVLIYNFSDDEVMGYDGDEDEFVKVEEIYCSNKNCKYRINLPSTKSNDNYFYNEEIFDKDLPFSNIDGYLNDDSK